MRKHLYFGLVSVLMTMIVSSTAFAGTWKSDSKGWWYQNDDGSYPAGAWQWIDSNGDGTAECYYFYSDGYMAYNNDIDGSHVNSDGQWEVAGRIQGKAVSNSTAYSAGRNFSYAKYFKGKNALWYDYLGCYMINFDINPSNLIDRGDCYEVTGVSVSYPYEYATREEAERVLRTLKNREDYAYGFGNVTLNDNGTFSVSDEFDMKYSYPAWSGSIYIRKDAMLNSNKYGRISFASAYALERSEAGFYALHCAVAEVDENGYVTTIRRAEWG